MSQENLRALLAQLHKRLEKTGHVDQDARASLSTVMRDIERTLHREDKAGQAAAAPKVEALAIQLEVDHPALVQTLRELAILLGGAGI